jgi:hypothetical protein
MTTTEGNKMNTTENTPRPAYKDCGVCVQPKPGAVDWGCVCDRDTAEVLAEMRFWTD